MSQCSNRAHRIGQKDNVLVKYYILPGTIDAHMIKTWIKKEEILEKALDTERPELADEAILIPQYDSIASRKELQEMSYGITNANRLEIHGALKQIQPESFTDFERKIFETLRAKPELNPCEAALGKKLLDRTNKK
jgi:hypothetical protein